MSSNDHNGREPEITVNGRRLTDGQALAVRVAVGRMHMEMGEPDALGPGGHGLARAYRTRLEEVLRMMIEQEAKGE